MKRICRIALMLMLAAGAATASSVARADDRIEIAADDCQAKPVRGGIDLSASERTSFEIYSITGQKVKSEVVEDGTVKAELPKGCYIVRCSKWSKKVVVK